VTVSRATRCCRPSLSHSPHDIIALRRFYPLRSSRASPQAAVSRPLRRRGIGRDRRAAASQFKDAPFGGGTVQHHAQHRALYLPLGLKAPAQLFSLGLECVCGETIEIPTTAVRAGIAECAKCGTRLEINWAALAAEKSATKPEAARRFGTPGRCPPESVRARACAATRAGLRRAAGRLRGWRRVDRPATTGDAPGRIAGARDGVSSARAQMPGKADRAGDAATSRAGFGECRSRIAFLGEGGQPGQP